MVLAIGSVAVEVFIGDIIPCLLGEVGDFMELSSMLNECVFHRC